MVALRPLDADLLRRCQTTGIGAFDISDQEFSAQGSARVIADLETVASRRLANPRWFGGELLLASADLIEGLVPCALECFHRYIWSMPYLNHQGDDGFISAALHLLCEYGCHGPAIHTFRDDDTCDGRAVSWRGNDETAFMIHSEIYKFPYTRTEGMHRTYDVTINLARRESGVFAYEAWVHFAGIFKGNGLVFPLISQTAAQAAAEARSRIEDHIEHLLGVAE